MRSKFISAIVLASLLGFACGKTEDRAAEPQAAPASDSKAKTPTITLSRERIPQNGWLKMYGKGFTPKQNVQSHLRRPNGTEFAEVSILTNAQGEFEHDVDTLLLLRGVHDLWVVDSATGQTSNVAHFEATDDPGPSERPTS